MQLCSCHPCPIFTEALPGISKKHVSPRTLISTPTALSRNSRASFISQMSLVRPAEARGRKSTAKLSGRQRGSDGACLNRGGIASQLRKIGAHVHARRVRDTSLQLENLGFNAHLAKPQRKSVCAWGIEWSAPVRPQQDIRNLFSNSKMSMR